MEDAKISKKNILPLQVDFSSAISSIDHARLCTVMADLGFPPDAVRVVQNLYTGAITTTRTSAGSLT